MILLLRLEPRPPFLLRRAHSHHFARSRELPILPYVDASLHAHPVQSAPPKPHLVLHRRHQLKSQLRPPAADGVADSPAAARPSPHLGSLPVALVERLYRR